MKNIFRNFILFFVIFSILIFLVGVFETTRNQFLFSIVEDNFLNSANTPTVILNQYYDFRNNYIFTNSVFVDMLNYAGMLVLFLIFIYAWRSGYNAKPYKLSEVFLSYSMFLTLLLYILFAVFEYLKDLLVNQLIIILFNDIYNAVFIYKIFIEWFVGLVLLAYALSFLANQIRHFNVLSNI